MCVITEVSAKMPHFLIISKKRYAFNFCLNMFSNTATGCWYAIRWQAVSYCGTWTV